MIRNPDPAQAARSSRPPSDERRQVASVAAVSIVIFAALTLMQLASPPLAPRVNVRWTEVSEQQRTEAERELKLVAPQHLEGTTWAYDLADPSPASVNALVHHPAVEDTYGIDRQESVVAADASHGTTRIGRYPFGAWVDSQPVAWLTLGSVWAALVSGAWLVFNRRSATPETNHHTPASIRSSG